MRRILETCLAVAAFLAACQSRILSSELMAPASVFPLTRMKGSDLGTDWQSTDICVHQRADSQYIGTVTSTERTAIRLLELGAKTLAGASAPPLAASLVESRS